MKDSEKGFRFLVGCFVLFAAWKLYSNGWFDAFFGTQQTEAVGNADLVALAIQAIVSAVEGIGYLAILIVAGAWPAIESLLKTITGLMPVPRDEQLEQEVERLRRIVEDANEAANLETLVASIKKKHGKED